MVKSTGGIWKILKKFPNLTEVSQLKYEERMLASTGIVVCKPPCNLYRVAFTDLLPAQPGRERKLPVRGDGKSKKIFSLLPTNSGKVQFLKPTENQSGLSRDKSTKTRRVRIRRRFADFQWALGGRPWQWFDGGRRKFFEDSSLL